MAVSVMSQEISLRSSPSTLKILPGEPASFQLTIRNTSGKSLKVVGTTLENALTPTKSILISADGQALNCSDMAVSVVINPVPPCQRPTIRFLKDGKVSMPYGIYSQKSCPLRNVPPGRYMGRVTVEIQACCQRNAKVIKQTLDIPVIVKTPQGQDAAYLKAIEKIVKQQPPKYRGTYGGELKWMEVLHSPRIHSEQLLLSNFPTSTYAGYAVGLGQGFHMILDSKPEYVAKTLWQQNYIQGHPKASIHQKVVEGGKAREVWQTEPMPKYLEDQRSRIQNYLAIHPDHARRDIMELAVAYQSLALGDKDTAIRALERVSKIGKTPKWKRQAIDLLKLLKAKKSGASGRGGPRRQP